MFLHMSGCRRFFFYEVSSLIFFCMKFQRFKDYDDQSFWMITQKCNSQGNKGCQVSDAFGNGSRQQIVVNTSAPKHAYTDWVRCRIQCLPHHVYVVFFFFEVIPPLSTWVDRVKKSFQSSQWLRWDEDTHMKMRDVKFMMLSDVLPPEVFASNIYSMPLRYALSLVYMHFSKCVLFSHVWLCKEKSCEHKYLAILVPCS